MGDFEKWLSYLSFVVGGLLLAWAFLQPSGPIGSVLLLASIIAVLLGVFFLKKVKDRDAINL